jgi:anaerobic ribonucleoside-triphosphate reductase
MMMKFASETTKPFVDDFLLSAEARSAVQGGYIHIHDKDYYPTKSLTCIQHPLDRILENGFKAGHGSSRPAKRIETASILGCISMETVQNEMHGGQAIPAFDYYMAPYVRNTFIEELKKVGNTVGKDLSKYYDYEVEEKWVAGEDEGAGLTVIKQPTFIYRGDFYETVTVKYTGKSVQPEISYDARHVKISGEYRAVVPGKYQIVFKLKDPYKTYWEGTGGSTSDIVLEWVIAE